MMALRALNEDSDQVIPRTGKICLLCGKETQIDLVGVIKTYSF